MSIKKLLMAWLLPLTELLCVGSIVGFLYTNYFRLFVQPAKAGVVLSNRMTLNLLKNCEHYPCSELLSEEEHFQYEVCFNKTSAMAKKFGPIKAGKCHFQDGFTRYPVALGSFQGSGNTWIRGLLEAVTGICTGSLYCDGALRTKGFSGEGVHGASVLAIKSHSINPLFTNMEKLPVRIPSSIPVFGAAIVLIRNPRNALIAEWHRESTKRKSNVSVSNHFLHVGSEYFGLNPDWNEYVIRMSDRWKHHVCGWLLNGKSNPLHIVKFESLKDDTMTELVRIVNFFGRTRVDVKSKLHYTQFYRNHTDDFKHFTSDQEKYISETVVATMGMLKEHYDLKSEIMTVLESYLAPEL